MNAPGELQNNLGDAVSSGDSFSLSDLFAVSANGGVAEFPATAAFTRNQIDLRDSAHLLLDRFRDSGAECSFLRLQPSDARVIHLTLAGSYQLRSSSCGGWLLKASASLQPCYWIARFPMSRAIDSDGHILHEKATEVVSLDATSQQLEIGFRVSENLTFDCVVWRLPPTEVDLISALDHPSVLEVQSFFMWSSHTTYSCPAHVYLHLVHGHVYENHTVWPRYWRVCSELDAYSLYVTLSGLERATDKRLYTLLKTQVVHSVIARQAKDGGWYHGEWTDGMESHYRLVNAAVLMLAAYVEQHEDKAAKESLQKAVAFLAARAHTLDVGAWFLHDSLEANVQGMREYPFAWSTSTALGKEKTNMLILNTHLDSMIALDRYAEATRDRQHQALVDSAKDSAMAVLMLRPAEWLYRLIFRILDLTLLPKEAAERLPLPKRMIKRVGWKYIAPSLHRLKALFPRLVMPNGFIDRSLCQKGFSTRYQSVHVWDLVRYIRRFPGSDIEAVLKRAVEYTYQGNMRAHWRESPERQDAFGFWIEALYHLCLMDSDPKLRRWLAEAVIDAETLGLGLPPSVLGTNNDAIRLEEQRPCPAPADRGLRVINLSRSEHTEYLVVNAANQALPLEWEMPPWREIVWTKQGDQASVYDMPCTLIDRHGWAVGRSRSW